jgi:hypothetical protein
MPNLKEGCLGVFKSIVLRKIFGPTNKEVTERWRNLHKEFGVLYSSQNVFFAHQMMEDEVEGSCGAHAAELNVGRP